MQQCCCNRELSVTITGVESADNAKDTEDWLKSVDSKAAFTHFKKLSQGCFWFFTFWIKGTSLSFMGTQNFTRMKISSSSFVKLEA